MMKLIKNDLYLLLIDEEAEIKEENIAIHDFGMGYDLEIPCDKDNLKSNTRKLVVAYYPLTKEAEELDLPLLPNPFEGEELDVEQLSHRYYFELEEKREKAKNFKGQVAGRHPDMLTSREMYAAMGGFVDGYKAAQSKQEELIDSLKHIESLCDNQNPTHETIWRIAYGALQSLSTQKLPKEFISEYEYVESVDDLWEFQDDDSLPKRKLKTITNSEGKQELVGIYKY